MLFVMMVALVVILPLLTWNGHSFVPQVQQRKTIRQSSFQSCRNRSHLHTVRRCHRRLMWQRLPQDQLVALGTPSCKCGSLPNVLPLYYTHRSRRGLQTKPFVFGTSPPGKPWRFSRVTRTTSRAWTSVWWVQLDVKTYCQSISFFLRRSNPFEASVCWQSIRFLRGQSSRLKQRAYHGENG